MNFLKRIIFGSVNKAVPVMKGEAQPLSLVPSAPRFARIWTVGGGKGGVGKSIVAANLGILLSGAGKRVLLVDADLGAANLHTFLGAEGSRQTLSNFLKSDSTDLGPYIETTKITNLDLISGAKDSLSVADQPGASITRLRGALFRTDYDYAVLDIGPGTSVNTLDLFLTGDEGILVTTPEPTSIENTYRFLKCLFLRRIKNICNSQEDSRLKDMLNRVFAGHWSGRIKTVSDILLGLKELDPEKGEMLRELLGDSRISLIVNQTKKPSDSDIGYSMSKACNDYFGVRIGFLGGILYEEVVSDSIRSRKPLLDTYADALSSRAIKSCFERLIGSEKKLEMTRAN